MNHRCVIRPPQSFPPIENQKSKIKNPLFPANAVAKPANLATGTHPRDGTLPGLPSRRAAPPSPRGVTLHHAKLDDFGFYEEGNGETDPGLFGLLWSAAVFAFYAIAVALGIFRDWLIDSLQTRWYNFLFRLTTHVDCCVCKRRVHRAPFHYRRALWEGGPKQNSISHTYCKKCLAKVPTLLAGETE